MNSLREANCLHSIEVAEGAEKFIRKELLIAPGVGPEKARSIFIGIETSPVSHRSFQHRLVVINKSDITLEEVENLVSKSYKKYLTSIDRSHHFLSPRVDMLN